MPLYHYECAACGEKIEEMRRIEDRHWQPDQPCPVCGFIDTIALVVSSPMITSRVGDNVVAKTDSQFKERLKQIKETHKGSTIDV